MRRNALAAIALVASLGGCPLPQPLPDYPPGTITPPRVLSASTTSGTQSILAVPAGCPASPEYPLDARIFYQESVALEARWFVDYRTDVASRYAIQNPIREVPPDPDPLVLERQVPTFAFRPYEFPPPGELGGGFGSWSDPGIVHVVELVVSNGFDPAATAEPNRTPATTPDGATSFEIQTYRWVFVTASGLPCP